MPKSKGSGIFSMAIGVCFFIAIFFNRFIKQLDPSTVLNIWLFFAAVILLFWGWQRVFRPNVSPPIVSQETFNFVVVIGGVTVALIGLLNES